MNNVSHNPADVDRSDDLDWLAFQYVAGELSPAETVAFEDRLACDRHACEAVARMMQTVDALAVAVPAADAYLAMRARTHQAALNDQEGVKLAAGELEAERAAVKALWKAVFGAGG